MRFPAGLGFVTGLILILSFAGCSKKRGLAVVLEKEHIAVREIISSPTDQKSASPEAATPGQSELASQEDEKPRELGKDEIVVESYVMKKEDRGTSRDPRAVGHEQWIVVIQMVEGGGRFNVQANRSQWEKVKVGDRIKVTYRQGKYTGTVWSAEID